MLGHISGRTAVLAPQRQALQQAQGNQNDRGRHTDRCVAGQQPDDRGRQAHDDDGDQKRVFAPDHVAQAAEHDGTERSHRKASGKGKQGENEGCSFIDPGEEVLGDDGRQ
ncbi:hypothetical protein D3C81_1668980 [compost metagenome]